MRRIFFVVAMLAMASLLGSCDSGAGNSSGSKPANAANGANSAAKSTVDTAAIETEIKRLVSEAAANMSKNDAAAFDKTTSDDYQFINPNGKISTKAERLAGLRSGESKFESVVYDDIKVRVHPLGVGAIVTGRATVKGVNMGTKVDGQYTVTQIWAKTDDGWKIVHSQATAISGGGNAPASNSSASTESSDAKANSNK